MIYASNPSGFFRNSGQSGNDKYTQLLLHGDESPLRDSSRIYRPLTLYGGVDRSSTESKFGEYSIYLDGTDDKIGALDSDDWFVGIDEFTVEMWIKWLTIPTNTWKELFGQGTDAGVSNESMLLGSAPGMGYLLNFTYFPDGSNYITVGTSGFSWTTNWTHLAVGRDNVENKIKIFVNGTLRGSGDIAADTSFYNCNKNFSIGGRNDTNVHNCHTYLDEFRFSKGIMRQRDNFTPNTIPYY